MTSRRLGLVVSVGDVFLVLATEIKVEAKIFGCRWRNRDAKVMSGEFRSLGLDSARLAENLQPLIDKLVYEEH